MQEPKWGYDFLKMLVDLWNKHQWIADFYPIGADIFVFVYPIFLTYWYLRGMITKNKLFKQDALIIFFSCLFSVIVNILSQQFFDKQRPIYELGTVVVDKDTILHQFLPVTSFPSDHAVVTFSIAMATLLLALRSHNKNLKIWSGFLFVFAVITGLCRIGTTVHRTTDILAGVVVGLLTPIVLFLPKPMDLLTRFVLDPIICFETRLMNKLFKRKTE